MIIVIGDSWGVGEWDRQGNLNGPGFAQYLMLHDRVINLSVGAGSNTQSLDRLNDLLDRFAGPHTYDTVFWIVTCPSRCASMDYFLESDKGLLSTAQKLLYTSFDKAQNICDRYQVKIQIIGGLCDLCEIDISAWPDLQLSVPSWCRLVDPDSSICLIYPNWWIDLGSKIRTSRFDLITEWLDLSQKILRKSEDMKNMFITDGCHPDRRGHKMLRDYFYPEWAHKT